MTSPNRSRISQDCEEFQRQLPEFFETGADLREDHIKNCENCASLVRDLQYIAAQAKLLLPIHDPSPAVWENLHNAISKEPHNGEESS